MHRSKAASPAPPESPSIRLSASKRREQLIEVAVDLFSRKGFNGTTTREIAAAAGVTEAMIFRHFATKEQLYTAIIDRKVQAPAMVEWLAGLKEAMGRNEDQAVFRGLIDAIIVTHRTDPSFERLMLYAALEGNDIALLYMQQITASVIEVFRTYFLRRQKAGHWRRIGPDVALKAIIGMAQQYALTKYVYGKKGNCMSDDEAAEGFTQIAMHGLRVGGAE